MIPSHAFFSCALFMLPFVVSAQEPTQLELADSRLQIELFADAPSISTPIGAAVDSQDRLYVVQSRTYQREQGPTSQAADQIVMLEDRDHDGHAESVVTAYEGLDQALNLAFGPEGILYVVCAREIVALMDHNQDGVFDSRRTLITLETRYRHPHYCLSGILIDPSGWLIFSRGNTGGYPYTLSGVDGSAVRGYGDGGAILRCTLSGAQLSSFATGFWNTFALEVDKNGRLFAADNDPEIGGPNRLLHIVQNGDYGYQTRYGRGSDHVLQDWNGDYPGALPMVSATREAPAGVIDCHRLALPEDYKQSLLVACWGESAIEVHHLHEEGLSVVGDSSLFLSGPEDFRPVAMVADSKGALYITDWAQRDYTLHGKGRVWRVTDRNAGPILPLPPIDNARVVFDEIASRKSADDVESLVPLLMHDDPFLTHAVVSALARPVFWESLIKMTQATEPAVRLGAMLALREANHPDSAYLIQPYLKDPNALVRTTALKWAAELRDLSLRPALDLAITSANTPLRLLETYLAAKAALDPKVVKVLDSGEEKSVFDLPVHDNYSDLATMIGSDKTSAILRMLALKRLASTSRSEAVGVLLDWMGKGDVMTRIAAIQGLSGHRDALERIKGPLMMLIGDPIEEVQVRAEAISVMSQLQPESLAWALPLLDDRRELVRLHAARVLRFSGQDSEMRPVLERFYERAVDDISEEAFAEQLEFALYGPGWEDGKFSRVRPQSLEEWQERLSEGGDIDNGRRVFQAAGLFCAQCHQASGLAVNLGPTLKHLSQSMDRSRIIESIIAPAREASPRYQAWDLKLVSGEAYRGVQLERTVEGVCHLITLDGRALTFAESDVESFIPVKGSMMPSGLQYLMTVQELREVVSFLESQGQDLD